MLLMGLRPSPRNEWRRLELGAVFAYEASIDNILKNFTTTWKEFTQKYRNRSQYINEYAYCVLLQQRPENITPQQFYFVWHKIF